MAKTKNTLPEAVTPEQIKAWKTEFKVESLKTLTIKAPDGSDALVILKPLRDRNVLALSLSNATQNLIVEAGQVILENCKLFIDPRIMADDNMYVTACVLANQCNELATGTLGNL